MSTAPVGALVRDRHLPDLGYGRVVAHGRDGWSTLVWAGQPVPREVRLADQDEVVRARLHPGQRVRVLAGAGPGAGANLGEGAVVRALPEEEPGETWRYAVRLADGEREVDERALEPCAAASADPLDRLEALDWDGGGAFLARAALLRVVSRWHEDAFGIPPLLGARVHPLAHQVHAARRVLTDRAPRFVLADEVGLGKTIEAGLVAQALSAVTPDLRVLVVAPGAMSRQWLCEMFLRFGEQVFVHLDLGRLDREDDPRALAARPRVIVSTTALEAWPGLPALLLEQRWDLVIVDEAHQVPPDRPLYGALRALAARAGAFLALSATPGKRDEAGLLGLLALVDPDAFDPASPGAPGAGAAAAGGRGALARRLAVQQAVLERLPPLLALVDRLEAGDEAPPGALAALAARWADAIPHDEVVADLVARLRAGDAGAAVELLAYVQEFHRVERRIVRTRRATVRALRTPLPPRQLEVLRYKAGPAEQALVAHLDALPMPDDAGPLALGLRGLLVRAGTTSPMHLLELLEARRRALAAGGAPVPASAPPADERPAPPASRAPAALGWQVRAGAPGGGAAPTDGPPEETPDAGPPGAGVPGRRPTGRGAKAGGARAGKAGGAKTGGAKAGKAGGAKTAGAKAAGAKAARSAALLGGEGPGFDLLAALLSDPGPRDEEALRDRALREAPPLPGEAAWLAEALEATRAWMVEAVGGCARFRAVGRWIAAHLRDGGGKVLVFCQEREVVDELAADLCQALGEGVALAFHHGLDDARLSDVALRFQAPDGGCRVLVSDELGGEGRNFQHAAAVVHLDQPWAVARLEQRIGRLDRIGRLASRPVLSVAVVGPSPVEQALLRLHRDVFRVYERSLGGLELVLPRLQRGLAEAACRGAAALAAEEASVGRAVAEALEAEDHAYERSLDAARAALEEATEQAEVLAAVDGGDDVRALSAWGSQLGVSFRTLTEDTWLASWSWGHLRRPLPGLPAPPAPPPGTGDDDGARDDGGGRARRRGTFSRLRALEDEALELFAPGHPLVDALARDCATTGVGRCAAIVADLGPERRGRVALVVLGRTAFDAGAWGDRAPPPGLVYRAQSRAWPQLRAVTVELAPTGPAPGAAQAQAWSAAVRPGDDLLARLRGPTAPPARPGRRVAPAAEWQTLDRDALARRVPLAPLWAAARAGVDLALAAIQAERAPEVEEACAQLRADLAHDLGYYCGVAAREDGAARAAAELELELRERLLASVAGERVHLEGVLVVLGGP